MSGFRAFVLRGNLVELAVAFIMGIAFATVVNAFVEWLTGLMPESASTIFSTEEQSFGAFLNATIAFLLLAVVVYFFVVMPYTRAKERYFPSEEPGAPEDVVLLTEIRDLLAHRPTGGGTTPPA
jgi:large conductance mechanosensitive channel